VSDDLLREAMRRFARVPPPAGYLQSLHGLKLSAGRAYDAAALEAPASRRALYETLAEHERKHAHAVATMLGALAAKQPRRPLDADVAALVPGVADGSSPRATLAAAERFEAAEVGAFEDVQARMTESKLLQTLLTIIAADAQHGVALRLALGEEPVPRAFS
jgi:rubrerythrin